MSMENAKQCPECNGTSPVDRREFIRTAGVGSAAVAASGLVTGAVNTTQAATPPEQPRQQRPAEALVRELYTGLNAEQREAVVRPWNHGGGENRTPTRLGMYNRPIGRRIGDVYTRPQQELIERILRAISSGDEGYTKLTRNGTFDGSRTLQGCGADIFGDPTNGNYSWVFSGHHLTVRCDGDSETNAAFGGPLYYGHSPNGYSERNCFFYQTRSAMALFDSLNEQQRRAAVVAGSPGERAQSIRFRNEHPGIPAEDLTEDQQTLVQTIMRQLLSPYRQQDANEVMTILRQNGGLDQLHLAFYANGTNREQPWRFWRIEGPSFVWNFRVLPHVHTFVQIRRTPQQEG